MASTYRYPVVVTEDRAGLFVACLLEEGHCAATGDSAQNVLIQLKEYLTWRWQEKPDGTEPDIHEPKVIDVQVSIKPEYKIADKVFPCNEMVPIKVPAVSARHASGMYIGLLPTLDIRFNYYDPEAFASLASHFAQGALAGRTPEELSRHLPLKGRHLEEIIITIKTKAKRASAKDWRTDQTIEHLAGVAEPLSARSVRGRYMRACRRDTEVAVLLDRLNTKQSNTLLVGDPGSGKTTVLTEVARRMERTARQEHADTPYAMWVTNAHRVIAGMRYLGQWEARCEKLIEELSRVRGILCVENLLDLIRTGGVGPLDSIAAFLMPYLRRGELALVAETTAGELEACRRLLPGFVDCFQILKINAFESDDACAVLNEMVSLISQNTHIEAEDGVAVLTFRLFNRFAPYSSFPGGAIDFLVRIFEATLDANEKRLTKDYVLKAFARQTGLPQLFLRDDIPLERKTAISSFSAQIIGQERACAVAANLVTRFKAGMNDPTRPIGIFIFCGPTGVGKTALACQLSNYFFGHGDESDRLIRLDMSEFGVPGAAGRLITSPDGGPSDLIKKMRRQPFSLVLLDEVEKAHAEVFDVLMNVFDEGRLSDPYGRITSFRSAIIIMTSNLGASAQGSLGFTEQHPVYEEEVMNFFRPEFFNRLDGVVTFDPLTHDSVLKIAEKELAELPEREGLKAYGIRLRWTPEVTEYVARAGFDIRYGARPLQRAIERDIITPLARLLAERPEVRGADLHLAVEGTSRVIVSMDESQAH